MRTLDGVLAEQSLMYLADNIKRFFNKTQASSVQSKEK
jgi:hypothetical protein